MPGEGRPRHQDQLVAMASDPHTLTLGIGGALPVEIRRLLNSGPEVMKRLYYRPDYQEVIRQFGAILLQELDDDAEAMEAFRDLLQLTKSPSDGEERIIPALIIGGAFVAGGVLGYFAEEGKASKGK